VLVAEGTAVDSSVGTPWVAEALWQAEMRMLNNMIKLVRNCFGCMVPTFILQNRFELI